ncbi:MAG: sensor domain-containing diguanylate cyclase [Vicinamibacteria bacterium]
MTHEIDALKAELANLKRNLLDLRVEFPDALLEGELTSERVVFMNRLACLVFGYSPEEVASLTAKDVFADFEYERAQRETRETLEQGYQLGAGQRYVRTGRQDLREFVMRRKDGSLFPAEIQSTMILDAKDQACGMRTVVRDITIRKQLEAKLEEMSYRDPLTGCFNRRYLDKRRAELEQDGAHWACLVFDLTGFKAINDTYGHKEGDRVLQAFAYFLVRLHRSEDILVRLGGDEFALFVKTPAHSEGPQIADRVIEAAQVDSPAAFNFGVALRLPGEDVPAALARADQVMYAAKGRSLLSTRR